MGDAARLGTFGEMSERTVLLLGNGESASELYMLTPAPGRWSIRTYRRLG